MASMKMLKGHSTDMNIDPHTLPREKRDEVGRKYFSHKASEMYYWIAFWVILGAFLYLLWLSFSNSFFAVPAGIMFFFAIRTHFNYLKKWSDWNKYARKNVVVMDPTPERVVASPKMPWCSLKAYRGGI